MGYFAVRYFGHLEVILPNEVNADGLNLPASGWDYALKNVLSELKVVAQLPQLCDMLPGRSPGVHKVVYVSPVDEALQARIFD